MALSALMRNITFSQVHRNAIKLAVNYQRTSLVNFSQTAAVSSCWNRPQISTVSPLQKAIDARKITVTSVRHSSDHRMLWKLEKALAFALLGVVPLTFLAPCTLFDDLFAITCVIHQQWGLEAIVVDYIRAIIFGEVIPKVTMFLLYVISVLTLGGLLYFNHTDIGIGQFVRDFWAKKPRE